MEAINQHPKRDARENTRGVEQRDEHRAFCTTQPQAPGERREIDAWDEIAQGFQADSHLQQPETAIAQEIEPIARISRHRRDGQTRFDKVDER